MRSPLRSWPVWQLPRWLATCVTAVIAAYAAATAGALASTPVRPGDLRLCAVFVGCGAASVELTRRAALQVRPRVHRQCFSARRETDGISPVRKNFRPNPGRGCTVDRQ